MTQTYAPARPPIPRRIPRAQCLTTAFVLLVTWPVAIVLFVLWIVSVVLSVFTVLMPLMVACTAMARAYAEAHRRWASRIMGLEPAPPHPGPPRPTPPHPEPSSSPTLFARAVAILRDPASWRRWLWLLVHAVVTPVLACLSIALVGSTVLYLAYPLLYAITPQQVFGSPFGIFELHTVGEAAIMMPLAAITFGLWFAIAPSLVRAQAAITCGLLGRRRATVPS